jgi:hypothetical protein
MAKARPKPPIILRNKLFDEVRSTCPNPQCHEVGVSALEIHHRDGDPSNNAEINLIALCGSCHTRTEKKLISETDFDLWKRMLPLDCCRSDQPPACRQAGCSTPKGTAGSIKADFLFENLVKESFMHLELVRQDV